MSLRLHVGCGTVYLDGYVNLDLEVPGYSFLASERPDLVAVNRTTVDRYYKHDETRDSLEQGTRNAVARVPRMRNESTIAHATPNL